MESDSVPLSICVNALSGTALDGVELVTVLLVVVPVDPTPDESAFVGAANTPEDGVYCTELVRAFEPADEDPDAAKDVDAPGPEPPDDALDCIYRSCSRVGLFWKSGSASRTT